MIIKCPECGHQVSDKAPVCPSCGVEIAGKIVRCPNCGEIHFISDGICPNCHHSLTATNQTNWTSLDNQSNQTNLINQANLTNQPNQEYQPEDSLDAEEEEEAVVAKPITVSTGRAARPSSGTRQPGGQPPTPKKSRATLIVSFIIAVIICLGLLFAYNNANQSNEARQYQDAIASRDPVILQSYLDTYKNAPTAHRDSVLAILNALRSADPAWDSARRSGDVAALKRYLQQNPNSTHKKEALDMIDELDWKSALQTHDFANYLSLHQNGRHASAAVDSVRLTMDMPADGADKQKAIATVRKFLVAINAHSADRVRQCVADNMEYFNEKSAVTGDEALNYMAIIYKDAERLNWHVDDTSGAKVTKKGDAASAQYSITMPARLSVNYKSGNNVQSRFRIQAVINPAGKISAIRLIRLASEKPDAAKTKKEPAKKADSKGDKEPA